MALTEDSGLVSSFEKLGLSPNEAKVYLALLENHPITGYQLSKNSGILRPVVYEMLNRLVEKGGARLVKSNPDTYEPVQIEEFLRNIEVDFSDARDQISDSLKGFLAVDESDFFWNLTGYKIIFNAVKVMIDNADTEILIHVNQQDYYNEISDSIEALFADNPSPDLSVSVFSHYSLQTGSASLYTYGLSTDFESELVPRSILSVSVDNRQALLAYFTDPRTSKAVQSLNRGLVNQTRQSILNSIYQFRLWKLHGTDKYKLVLNNEDKKLIETMDKHLSGRLF